MKRKIAVAYGDGIGPEIMRATLSIVKAAKAELEIHEVEIGEKVYLKGHPTGIEDTTWNTILSTDAFLKAPITTPQGGGFKSLNVTIRTSLGLYANIRPCISYAPFIATKHPKMDVVIVRENEEDLYAGIEYQQTPHVCESTKIISLEGSEKIIRYAFEYAVEHKRKKVTCFTKDNIMKFSDGLFHQVFDRIGAEYPEIEKEHWIVDIGAAKLADSPEIFDVIVMPNLYGDILSDVAAQISGSVGIAGSANIGTHGAMFEAIHGSAPRRAGQNVANPSGLLHGAIQMLVYLGQHQVAEKIHNAWLTTIEDGIHTYDIYQEGISKNKVSTSEFAEAVIARLGKSPHTLQKVHYSGAKRIHEKTGSTKESLNRLLDGCDIYLYHKKDPSSLIEALKKHSLFHLAFVGNRGVKIYPGGFKETFCIEQYRARFIKKNASLSDITALMLSLEKAGLEILKVVNLYSIDGKKGYSNAQDQIPE